jgi:transcriptional regulator with XRE-family HTH domain
VRGNSPLSPGKKLRQLREQLGLTVRDVEASSSRLASRRGNRAYSIPPSRLSDIENKEVVPSIYRVYSFAVIYRCNFREILSWYGIDLNDISSDLHLAPVRKTHRIESVVDANSVEVPVLQGSAFDPTQSCILGSMIQRWGAVPFSYLKKFVSVDFTYAYIGTDDQTMSPILPPGSFLQIDEARHQIVESDWKSEYDRPIYFLETRNGYRCGWCRVQGGKLALQPHPLSPEPVRIYRYPEEVDVVGQVVGVAMQLGVRSHG